MALEIGTLKYSLDQKVTLRPGIIVSEPFMKFDVAHYKVKDLACDRYYVIKRFENFLMSKMDGSRSFDEIFSEFEEHFQRPTTQEEREGIVNSFHMKGFVKEAADPKFVEELRQASLREQQAEKLQLDNKRLVLFKPELIFPYFKAIYGLMTQRWFIFLTIAVFLGTVVVSVLQFESYVALLMAADFSMNRIIFIIFMTFIFAFVHELGHGLSTLYFGGNCKEMGLTFRMVIPTPFCRIEPQFLTKRQRLYTFFAGQHVNMLILIGVFFLFQFAPISEWFYLTFVSFYCFAVFMLILGLRPFGGTDGYLMISDYTGRPNIDQEFRAWLWQKIRGSKGKPRIPYRSEYGLFWLMRIVFFILVAAVSYLVIFNIVLL